jgi:hypothetical protein
MNTYNRLSNDYEEDLVGIQALERKSKNDFIVRFEVSSDADCAALIEDTKRFYEEDLALTESAYRTQYQFTEQELNRERQHNTDIMKIISQLASTPVTINVESKSILQSDTFNNNFEDSTIGNFSNRIHDNGTQTTN